MGYHYNFKKNKFEKTGLLSVETMQNDVHIYVNGELYKHKVRRYSFIPKAILSRIEYPNNVKISLLPDEYAVRLAKEGYWDWKNTVSIYPNYTTFIKPVILFKKSIPFNLKGGEITNLIPAGKGSIIFLELEGASTTLASLNLENFEERKIYESEERIGYVPSANSQRILIKEKDGYKIIDPISSENAADLKDILDSEIKNVIWHEKNDYKLYAIEGKSGVLYEIDLVLMAAKPLTILSCQDFIMSGDDVLALESDSEYGRTVLKKIKGDSEEIMEVFPYSKDMGFIKSQLGYAMVKDRANNILYIVDFGAESASKIKAAIHGITEFDIDSSQRKILYANDYEIWTYDLNEDKKSLITRVSSPITGILWHANENYIIFSTGKRINLIKISDFGNNNYLELVSANKIDEISLGPKGRKLYFTGIIGAQEGLFELELY